MTCDLLRLQPECDVTSVGRASTAMSSLANTMHAPVKAAAAVGETKFDNVKVIQCAALMSRVGAQRRSNCESHTFECHFVDFEQGEWWQLPLSDAVTQVGPHMQLQLPRASHSLRHRVCSTRAATCACTSSTATTASACAVSCSAQLTFSHAHQGARINYKARPGEL